MEPKQQKEDLHKRCTDFTPEEIADDFLAHITISDPMERRWFRYNLIENLKIYSEEYASLLLKEKLSEAIKEMEEGKSKRTKYFELSVPEKLSNNTIDRCISILTKYKEGK